MTQCVHTHCPRPFPCHRLPRTGTSIITCPPLVCDPIIAKINVTDDCSNLATLPPLAFLIGQTTYTLTANQYVVKLPATDADVELVNAGRGAEASYSCQLGVQSFDVGIPQLWILCVSVVRARCACCCSPLTLHPPQR